MMNKLGHIFTVAAIVLAGAGVAILKKNRTDILDMEETLEESDKE